MRRRWSWLRAVPLALLSLLLICAAGAGLAHSWQADPAALRGDTLRAAETVVLCLALAVPAMSRRVGMWLLILCVPPLAGFAAVLALPPGRSLAPVPVAAVMLLPAMVIILRLMLRKDFAGARDEALAQGAGAWRARWLGLTRPSLPDAARAAACGLAAVFLLALGLGPMLAGLHPTP